MLLPIIEWVIKEKLAKQAPTATTGSATGKQSTNITGILLLFSDIHNTTSQDGSVYYCSYTCTYLAWKVCLVSLALTIPQTSTVSSTSYRLVVILVSTKMI